MRDISSGGLYALKHLRLNGDQEIIAEVQREAKTQAKLKTHPNILRLHAVSFAGPKGGETDGFFLLDYCPGTLLDLLQRHNFQLEERTVLHIFNCVCQAVAHMHRQKPPMAHRSGCHWVGGGTSSAIEVRDRAAGLLYMWPAAGGAAVRRTLRHPGWQAGRQKHLRWTGSQHQDTPYEKKGCAQLGTRKQHLIVTRQPQAARMAAAVQAYLWCCMCVGIAVAVCR